MRGIKKMKLKQFAFEHRLNKTSQEKKFYSLLHPIRNEFKIKIKNEYIIFPYIIDFYIPKYGIAIELDGGYHKNRIEYDSKRTSYLENRDIIVLHFDNMMIDNNIDWVLDVIRITIKSRLNYNFDNQKACNSNGEKEALCHPKK